jgi:hypothetical protein
MKLLLPFLIVIFGYSFTYAQLSAGILNEYQYGKIPSEQNDLFHANYSNVYSSYQYRSIKMSGSWQVYQTPYKGRNYIHLSSFSTNYRAAGTSFSIGNYSEVLGNGLLLRSYSIPGAILEDKGFRSKQSFYTDVLGANFAVIKKKYQLKILWGYALNNLYPPTVDWSLRRSDELYGVEFNYKLRKCKIGGSALRVQNDLEDSYYGLLSASGYVNKSISYNLIYASFMYGEGLLDKEHSFAFYGSLNFSLPSFGLSLEYKNYQNFVIGSGINEPPALIKEHSYRLLNRSTHVLQPDNESGIQLEAFYQPSLFSTLTFNYSLARNNFHRRYTYQEYFLEYSGSIFDATDLKAFVDIANDPFKDEKDRLTVGANIDQPITKNISIILEGEWQRMYRSSIEVSNFYSSIGFRNTSKLYLGISSEWSNDFYITSLRKIWLGSLVKYKVNSKHTVQLFAGQRRGGPACNAGICYEVLDFKGLEIRWNARF